MTDRRRKLLFDAISAIEAARSFVADVTLEHYESDRMRRSATERQLEILGESCARLAREDQQGFDAVPSARLAVALRCAALRNRIIHGYDAVDDETVFRTVCDDLPALASSLREWLNRLNGPA